MPSTVQVDAQGRLKLNPQGMVILSDAEDPCCCGGGTSGTPCSCHSGTFTECPGSGDTICCSALTYTATISATGSCECNVDPTKWQLSETGQPGLFTGDEDAIPDPPPTSGVLFEGTWSLDMTVTKTCVDGFNQVRSSGTLAYDYVYYGYDEGTATWGEITDTVSFVWTDEPGSNVMGLAATVDPFVNIPFPAVAASALLAMPRGLLPFILGPQTDCVESWPNGSLSYISDRVPWYGLRGTLAGVIFYPNAGFNEYQANVSGSNSCAVRENDSRVEWDLLGLDGDGDPQVYGSAVQEYDVGVVISATTECDPDPCA